MFCYYERENSIAGLNCSCQKHCPDHVILYTFPSVQTCARPTITDGSTTPDQATIDYGDSYIPACDTGYDISGSDTLVCVDGGVLSPSAPTCSSTYIYDLLNI